MSLERELEQALRGTYEAAKKRGYVANYFLKMLDEHGGLETAHRLLAKPDAQIGLSRLWELDILNESVEAVIWENTRFHPFFTALEIEEAHRRLDELGYFKKGK